MDRSRSLVLALAVMASVLPIATIVEASAQVPADTPVAAARETEPVVLTGASFPTWAVPADVTAKAPSIEGKQCLGATEESERPPLWSEENCSHNEYEDPEVSSGEHSPLEGQPIDRLIGFKWDGEGFVEIPFQVDEMTQRYLSNNNSGFAFYSETDPHHTYIFDREGFRWTGQDENNPCLAQPVSEVAPDPVAGLDSDDELAFMARDTGAPAPTDAPLPEGIAESYRIAVTDPANGNATFAYVMLATEDGPRPSFNADNGYVRYDRDEDSNVYLFSESSYDSYGAAPKGAYFDPETGQCVTSEAKQRRPGDQATISTPRYQFRYEGRWLMTDLRVSQSPEGDWTYAKDLVDQWKARAFQQRPSGDTPCCGFEEEVNNWGGSSILMGERWGPVRVIRETWGADSGTNVVRREIFYRDEIRFGTFLRVHVIPPLDGIYAQWDYNALNVDTYYNQYNPDGVRIDGKNDERFGNSRLHVSQEGAYYCGQDEISEAVGAGDCDETPFTAGNPQEPCPSPGNPVEDWWDEHIVGNDPTGQIPDDPTGVCIFNDIDSPDPTFSGVNAGLNWEEVDGPYGTLVMRTGIKQFTPGGTAQSLLAVPYYRDDSCFDDGTGSNPGPHVHGRGVDGDETSDERWDSDGDGDVDENDEKRVCWDIDNQEHVAALAAESDNSHPRFYQGSIGTHGVHILLIADSDNAGTTLALTEIDSEQRMVVLRGDQGNVGEAYGRHTEKPLVAVAHAENREQGGAEPQPTETPTPTPTPSESASSTPSPTPTETTTPDPDPTETATPDPDPSNTHGSPSPDPGNGGNPGGGQTPSGSPTHTPDEEVTEHDQPGRATTSLSANRRRVRFNRPVVLEGRVEATGCDAAPTTVTIQRRDHGSESFITVADDVEIQRDGSWTASARSKVNASYVAAPNNTTDCTGSSSAPVDVLVKAAIDISTIEGDCSNGRVRGRVLPNHAGDKVVLQQKSRDRFGYVSRARLNKKSAFALNLPSCRKTYRLVFKKQDVRNERTVAKFRF